MPSHNPVKLLVVSTNGVTNDGITSWFLQYFGHMDQTGIQVDTVAFEGVSDDLVSQVEDINVRVFILPARGRHPLRYMRSLRRLVRANSYDIVHINGNSGTVAIDLLCTVLTTAKTRIVHSRNTQGMYPLYDRALRPLMNLLCTDRLACGKEAGRWLFGDSDFMVIPNGKDFDRYAFSDDDRGSVRAALGLSDDHVVIGHVGNFTEQKNHQFLLAAFAKAQRINPNLRLVLIGDGALRPAIERLIAQLDIADSVHLVGRTGDVPRYLSAFDLAVLPSLYEGFPNVVIEWQVSGLPSVVSSAVTDECAISELVTLVPAGDTEVWSRAMAAARPTSRVLAAESAQSALKEAGYDVVDGAAKLRGIYAQSASKSRQPRTAEAR